jgi:hypothetical protein
VHLPVADQEESHVSPVQGDVRGRAVRGRCEGQEGAAAGGGAAAAADAALAGEGVDGAGATADKGRTSSSS